MMLRDIFPLACQAASKAANDARLIADDLV
jgi:hypothetical protein